MPTLTDTDLFDIFVTALEGGINYWAEVLDYQPNEHGDWYAVIVDVDDFSQQYRINKETVRRGIDDLSRGPYHQHYADLVNENYDSITADVIVQLALFDGIVYG
jgi:hypothetical protein